MIRSLLLALLLTTTAWAQGVGMVTAVTGNVRSSKADAAEFLDPVASGSSWTLPAGSRLEITYYTGQRFTVEGPGQVKVGAQGVTGKARITRQEARRSADGRAVRPVSGTLGAAYERNGKEGLKVTTRGGQRSTQPELSWTPVKDARKYRVRILDTHDIPKLEQDVAAPATQLALSEPLAPGLYRLQVRVFDPEWGLAGEDAAGESSFYVLTPTQLQELSQLEGAAGADALLLARYLQLNLYADAARLGRKMLARRQDPGLRKLVEKAEQQLP